MTTKEAVDHLRNEFEKDPDFKETYVANIAMSFYDAYRNAARKNNKASHDAKGLKFCKCGQQNRGSNRKCFACNEPLPNTSSLNIHEIANKAANNFMDLWMKK